MEREAFDSAVEALAKATFRDEKRDVVVALCDGGEFRFTAVQASTLLAQFVFAAGNTRVAVTIPSGGTLSSAESRCSRDVRQA